MTYGHTGVVSSTAPADVVRHQYPASAAGDLEARGPPSPRTWSGRDGSFPLAGDVLSRPTVAWSLVAVARSAGRGETCFSFRTHGLARF